MNESRRYEIGLSLLTCLKPAEARTLLEKTGSAEAVFSDKHLRSIEDLSPAIIQEITKSQVLKRADKEIEQCFDNQIHISFLTDPDYPVRLSACPDAPVILYSKGFSNLNATHIVSVVGTRRATRQGRAHTEELVKELATAFPDLILVSGLAYGIDITANRTAVSTGLNTVAVVAHGLQEIYPPTHRQTAQDIEKNGCILSELPYGTAPLPWRFLQRNRIIAGLCDACIVVESAEYGGSIKTADFAISYGRDVFAYPGRPSDEHSKGCNKLIKNQVATLAECTEDILTAMNWSVPKQHIPKQTSLFPELSSHQKALYDNILPGETKSISDLSYEMGFSMGDILSNLLQLELTGLIEAIPGGFCSRKRL